MFYNYDILYNILYFVYKYNYAEFNSFIKITNKNFNIIYNKLKNIFNISEELYMATNIKHYRPELEQVEYIWGNFIIFNNKININNLNIWMKNSTLIKYHSYNPYIIKLIIPIITNTLYNKEYFNDIIDINNLKKKNFQYKFKEYFIYYFWKDLNTCYNINIIILPYYNHNLTKNKFYLHYNLIKINEIYNHNINKINGILF